ncbi:flagellin N-terminal helical domain-containing protein [Oikeobacillus pervagus]
MEKLSSGLRINKAGDDAAGLAISEKMRGQIRGLDMAAKNAQDGVSLLQTAEGALNETHSILQRMRELAVQSSNDTNTDADRESINTEINQLKEEIDRIGNTTEFNTKKLIDGSIGEKKVAGTDNAAVISSALGKETAAQSSTTVDGSKLDAFTGGSQSITIDGAKISFTATQADYRATSDGSGTADVDAFASQLQKDINKAIDAYNTSNGTSIANVTVSKDPAAATKVLIKSGSEGATSTIHVDSPATGATNLWEAAGFTVDTAHNATGSEGVVDAAGGGSLAALKTLAGTAGAATFTFEVDGKSIAVDLNDQSGSGGFAAQTVTKDSDMGAIATGLQKDLNEAIKAYNATVPTSEQVKEVSVSVKDGAFVVESGSDKATSSIKFDNSEAAQLLGLAKQNSATQGGGVDFQIGANQTQTMKVTIEDMRTDALGIKDIDLSNKAGAEEAITKINDAIEKVSTQRSNLGAFQNRLEHTINNLGTSSENLTAAESRVRDVDMAKEMMEQTKNSILSQAAQAMLAQANQQPQGVLQLLR